MVRINSFIFFIFGLLITLLLTGCSLSERSPLSIKAASVCVKVSAGEVGSLSAEKHYEYMVGCAKSQQFSLAVVHYAMAGVITWHDYLVTPGNLNKQRHQDQLRRQLAGLSDNEKRLLWEELNITLHDTKRRDTLCETIILPDSNKRSKMLWQQAKNGYLHCAKEKFSNEETINLL